jgi:hypothetical protein
MRASLPVLVLAAAATAGCQPDCGTPRDFDGVRWDVFGNPVDFTAGQTGAPPGQTLINGHTEWEIQWGDTVSGPITVLVDDQPFQGEGVWDTQQCGAFAASFTGTFRSRDGTDHNFTTSGLFWYFDVLLEGAVSYNETFTAVDGTIGSLNVRDGSVSGRRITGP